MGERDLLLRSQEIINALDNLITADLAAIKRGERGIPHLERLRRLTKDIEQIKWSGLPLIGGNRDYRRGVGGAIILANGKVERCGFMEGSLGTTVMGCSLSDVEVLKRAKEVRMSDSFCLGEQVFPVAEGVSVKRSILYGSLLFHNAKDVTIEDSFLGGLVVLGAQNVRLKNCWVQDINGAAKYYKNGGWDIDLTSENTAGIKNKLVLPGN